MDGTSFLVDCFGKQAQMLKCRSWFLTHFHSDHYKGLRASFKAGATLLQPRRCSEQPVCLERHARPNCIALWRGRHVMHGLARLK